MKSISMSLGGNSNTYSLMKPSNSAPTGLPKDPTTSICSQALTGTPIDSSGPSYQSNRRGTSKHGFRAHCVSKMQHPPSHVPCATSRQLPPDWLERITGQDEDPLWSKGWMYAGLAFTLDATPSHYDPRSQIWVFGLCIHTQSMGQLKRLGAITGVAQGPQSKGRALFAGLVALAKHTTTPAKVIVQLSSQNTATTSIS